MSLWSSGQKDCFLAEFCYFVGNESSRARTRVMCQPWKWLCRGHFSKLSKVPQKMWGLSEFHSLFKVYSLFKVSLLHNKCGSFQSYWEMGKGFAFPLQKPSSILDKLLYRVQWKEVRSIEQIHYFGKFPFFGKVSTIFLDGGSISFNPLSVWVNLNNKFTALHVYND